MAHFTHMAKTIYGPYLLPSVSVSKSRMRVCLGHDLCVEFCICILLFTHLNKNACGVYFAICICILYPYPVFGAHSVSRIPYPVSVSCIWGSFSIPYPVSRIRILLLGSALCLASSILHFESCGLGCIPYPVSRIRIPYRRDINVIFSR